jgi:hypothetical protein
MTTPNKKPFSTTKPRSEWRKCFKRVRGRVLKDLQVGKEPGDTKIFIFELRSDGLHVRMKHSPRRCEKVWKFESLANGVALGQVQMKLL